MVEEEKVDCTVKTFEINEGRRKDEGRRKEEGVMEE